VLGEVERNPNHAARGILPRLLLDDSHNTLEQRSRSEIQNGNVKIENQSSIFNL